MIVVAKVVGYTKTQIRTNKKTGEMYENMRVHFGYETTDTLGIAVAHADLIVDKNSDDPIKNPTKWVEIGARAQISVNWKGEIPWDSTVEPEAVVLARFNQS